VGVVLVGTGMAVATPAGATFPGDAVEIMFARWGPGFRNYGFSTIRPDGTGSRPVGFPGMEDASWAPDGQSFAYAAYVSGGPKVFVVDVASGVRSLVVSSDDFPVDIEYIGDVAFGPGGDRLVIGVQVPIEEPDDPFGQLFVVDVDGTDLTQISGDRELSSPDWSSTDRIVATTGASGISRRTTLVTLDPDGGGVARVIRLEASRNPRISVNGNPSWSPDGAEIAFISQSGRRRPDVWVVDADGTDARRVIDTPRRWEWRVVWSPVGDAWAVSIGGRDPAATTDLWVVRTGGGRTRLTDTPGREEIVMAWRAA
jgi:Tol biopolymer transport system component